MWRSRHPLDATGAAEMTITESQLKQDLREARALFKGPKNWTRGALARDYYGAPLQPYNYRARQWCLAGALQKVGERDRILACYDVVYKVLPPLTISKWNDDPARTFADVTELLDRAIESAP